MIRFRLPTIKNKLLRRTLMVIAAPLVIAIYVWNGLAVCRLDFKSTWNEEL